MKYIVLVLVFFSVAWLSSCCFMVYCDECEPIDLVVNFDKNFSQNEIDSFLVVNKKYNDTTRLVEEDYFRNNNLSIALREMDYTESYTFLNSVTNKSYNLTDAYYKKGKSKGCCDCGGVEYVSFNYNNVEQRMQDGDTLFLHR